jgi:hypothetical protein
VAGWRTSAPRAIQGAKRCGSRGSSRSHDFAYLRAQDNVASPAGSGAADAMSRPSASANDLSPSRLTGSRVAILPHDPESASERLCSAWPCPKTATRSGRVSRSLTLRSSTAIGSRRRWDRARRYAPAALAPGLTLGVLPWEQAEAYMDAAESRGTNFKPTRQFGQRSALVMRDPPGRSTLGPGFSDPERSGDEPSYSDNGHDARYSVRVIKGFVGPGDGRQIMSGRVGRPGVCPSVDGEVVRRRSGSDVVELDHHSHDQLHSKAGKPPVGLGRRPSPTSADPCYRPRTLNTHRPVFMSDAST